VKPPYNSGLALIVGPSTNKYMLGTGQYYLNGDFILENNESMYISGTATVYVTGNFAMGNTSSIVISAGASLKLYIGSSSGAAVYASLGMVNTLGNANSFQLYGLPTLTSLAWGGNTAYLGTVYAPKASLTLGAGGSTALDFQGAVSVQSISMNGHFNFHFDESLKQWGPTR
jgi:hypothetical protein